MKKYIAPSVEIVNVKTMAILEVSIPVDTDGENRADSKSINFADDNLWSTEE